ncbi:MAG: antibiotic biosynthesis monooxygenase [Sphingomonadaceae bacterium]|jgi:heme-degrading monooxygenase HmoA|nr:antibiotic biosynthesis monooxygenase [Sphingomonadaceae bacterium]
MIAVIFEVEPAPGHNETYLDTAAGLRPLLYEIEGFISVERFQSLTNPGKLVSLSFFENEAAVRRWRETAEHRAAQSAGRSGVFTDYRLRVASVIRDYSLHNRKVVPQV